MFELIIMISLLLLAAAVGAYLHHRLKAKERGRREWHRQFDSHAARRSYANASTTSSRRDDPMADPLHPLNPIGLVNPISPISPFNPANSSSSQSDDTPARTYS